MINIYQINYKLNTFIYFAILYEFILLAIKYLLIIGFVTAIYHI
jgi:hypothetical protein